jgi:hypothetical protein
MEVCNVNNKNAKADDTLIRKRDDHVGALGDQCNRVFALAEGIDFFSSQKLQKEATFDNSQTLCNPDLPHDNWG